MSGLLQKRSVKTKIGFSGKAGLMFEFIRTSLWGIFSDKNWIIWIFVPALNRND